MPVPASSLSVAIQGIADFMNEAFANPVFFGDHVFGGDVITIVDTPQRASEKVKSADDKHFLNLFVYRVAPSGFHAAAGKDERKYIRVNALLTPFLGNQQNQASDADLRILGHAIRILESHPVLPIIPSP